MASARPYANHCTSLQTDNHASASSQPKCSWCPANSVKALQASTLMVFSHNCYLFITVHHCHTQCGTEEFLMWHKKLNHKSLWLTDNQISPRLTSADSRSLLYDFGGKRIAYTQHQQQPPVNSRNTCPTSYFRCTLNTAASQKRTKRAAYDVKLCFSTIRVAYRPNYDSIYHICKIVLCDKLWGPTSYLHWTVVQIETERDTLVKRGHRLLRAVDVGHFFWLHIAFLMINCRFNNAISYCLSPHNKISDEFNNSADRF